MSFMGMRNNRARQGALQAAAPLRGLAQRLGGQEVPSWACYLPDGLRPAGVSPAVPEAWACPARLAGPPKAPPAAPEPELPSCSSRELRGRVWELSQQPQGCRQVQAALEHAAGDEERQQLADELRGHVLQACMCAHANHVLQKVIVTLQPAAVQFVVDEVLAAAPLGAMAKHKFGCRILQRLLEYCAPAQLRGLVADLMEELPGLCRHMYGNYVAQAVLQHVDDEVMALARRQLTLHLRTIAAEGYGCAVLAAALACGSLEHRKKFAQVLSSEEGLLAFLAASRHGHVATLRALELLEGEALADALDSLEADTDSLMMSAHGREVLDEVEALLAKGFGYAQPLCHGFVGGA